MDKIRVNEIAEHLRKLRKSNHLTQDEVAKQLGVSFVAISHYETGKRRVDVTVLEELATIYHTTVDQILSDSKIQ